MAEIKTCEQYVLNQLALETERADMLQDERDSILVELNIVKARMKAIEELLSRHLEYSSDSARITMDYVWQAYNLDDFCLLQSIMNKQVTSEEETE